MSKKFFNLQDDVVFTTSRINEHVRFTTGTMGLTSSLGSGTVSSPHIKSYLHWNNGSLSGGFYQSIFDKDHTAPNANKLLDITFGASVSSSFVDPGTLNREEKIRIYRQFAKKLLGNPALNFVFQEKQRDELIFVCLGRNLYKDEIRPGTVLVDSVFSGNLSSDMDRFFEKRRFLDQTAPSIVEESPGGLRGFLSLESSQLISGAAPPVPLKGQVAGAVYYDAGILVLIPEVISSTASTPDNEWWFSGAFTSSYEDLIDGYSSFKFDRVISGMRQRLVQVEFRNQTNVRNTFYTCVADRSEFNYSPNPSFTDSHGEIHTTSGAVDFPAKTYITKVGLLGKNDEVIAVGQLSRPVRKDPTLRLEIKVRLDY